MNHNQYRKPRLPAFLLAGALTLAACSSNEVTASSPTVPSTSTELSSSSPISTGNEAAVPSFGPQLIVAGRDSYGGKVVISTLNGGEQTLYNQYGSAQAAAAGALVLGCNGAHLLGVAYSKGSDLDGGNSDFADADSILQTAQDTYNYALYREGKVPADSLAFSNAMNQQGCPIPQHPFEG